MPHLTSADFGPFLQYQRQLLEQRREALRNAPPQMYAAPMGGGFGGNRMGGGFGGNRMGGGGGGMFGGGGGYGGYGQPGYGGGGMGGMGGRRTGGFGGGGMALPLVGGLAGGLLLGESFQSCFSPVTHAC